jgi:hypothetical protein
MFANCARGFVAMFVVAACAMGSIPGEGPADAPTGSKGGKGIDARSPADAHGFNDAAVTQPDAAIDAGGGGGGLCNVNSDCPDSTTCCWVIACVPGTRVGNNLCFPS